MNDQRNYHIVVAAGSGRRFGTDLPKQFCELGERPLLMTTLERLHSAAPDAEIIVVVSNDMRDYWIDLCRLHDFNLPHRLVDGGDSRAASVRNALAAVDVENVGWISVHDAARPMVTAEMMGRLIGALSDERVDGAIPVVAVTDSLREIDRDGCGSRSVDRSRFRSVQTPQVFPGRRLLEANRQPLLPTHTDDASVMESAGFDRLVLVEGDPRNIKVTNPGDME
ncbi:MAG: 2-C-methyl-D-erythritol 4-phosphate cytidylyltransferase, partial [Duncaniella sp.]|nr:2-C-methyl-D-erythritol 4-phosphate cytidylyltransferase [Duncaniella sp.]